MSGKRERFFRWVSICALIAILLGGVEPAHAERVPAASPIPMLAYYYIWFDRSSWKRAKIDYPLLGNYSSDDRAVMRQHIQWAKAAGIDGFIVSWKSTDTLNRRLKQLCDLAEEENFKLVMIYEGLNFERNPLPAERVAGDLDFFIKNFAGRKAFDLFSKPMMIWSGTWMFSVQDIERVVKDRRAALLILASERNESGYLRLQGLVDGDAYYWASVNPETYPGYLGKLTEMGEAVHRDGGLWIPSAAPGFDARLVGGSSEVLRKDGDTFRIELNTARASSPDALGIISWNEFSENTYIEPSQTYGMKYLNILSGDNQLPPPVIADFDSSETTGEFNEPVSNSRIVAVVGMGLMVIVSLVVIVRRRS